MKNIIAGALLLEPLSVFAAETVHLEIIRMFGLMVNVLGPIIIVLAVPVFFWGLIKYIVSASDESARESGKTLMIWGMVALFVVSVSWIILGYMQASLAL